MKMSMPVIAFISACLCCSPALGSEDQNEELELKNLLLQAGDVDGWMPEGEAQFAEGEDLFLLINGGAEIYHEYGFKEVAFQTYSKVEGKSINLEIYEMESQEAAYGIYTFKTGGDGYPIEVGHEGWFESYYLNFWEGNFLITIVGLGTDADILDGIKKFAKAVDAKLKFKAKKPHIVSYLPEENLQPNGVTYLKGNLALVNRYRFDNKDIFGLKEGVIGKYDDYSIFIFQYTSKEDSEEWYEFAKNHLKQSKRFNDFLDHNTHFEISDHQNSRLWIKKCQSWILIVLGESNMNANQIFNSIEAALIQ